MLSLSALLAVMLSWSGSAFGQGTSAGTGSGRAAVPTEPAAATNAASAQPLSPGVGEILRMADAGVSTNVLKTYVETSAAAPQLTEADIIALKQHNVSDELVTCLLKRNAETRAATAQAKKGAAVGLVLNRRLASGGFDPDSYEYFQYYYLQPRAMASAYQRLAPYYYPPFSRAYGYRPGYGFGPPFYTGPMFHGPPPYR